VLQGKETILKESLKSYVNSTKANVSLTIALIDKATDFQMKSESLSFEINGENETGEKTYYFETLATSEFLNLTLAAENEIKSYFAQAEKTFSVTALDQEEAELKAEVKMTEFLSFYKHDKFSSLVENGVNTTVPAEMIEENREVRGNSSVKVVLKAKNSAIVLDTQEFFAEGISLRTNFVYTTDFHNEDLDPSEILTRISAMESKIALFKNNKSDINIKMAWKNLSIKESSDAEVNNLIWNYIIENIEKDKLVFENVLIRVIDTTVEQMEMLLQNGLRTAYFFNLKDETLYIKRLIDLKAAYSDLKVTSANGSIASWNLNGLPKFTSVEIEKLIEVYSGAQLPLASSGPRAISSGHYEQARFSKVIKFQDSEKKLISLKLTSDGTVTVSEYNGPPWGDGGTYDNFRKAVGLDLSVTTP
jgi:hypothetical protein